MYFEVFYVMLTIISVRIKSYKTIDKFILECKKITATMREDFDLYYVYLR